MTMTEPSPQVTPETNNSNTANEVENSDTYPQEVKNLSDQCGGVSNLAPEIDNSLEVNEDIDVCATDNFDDSSFQEKKGKGKNVKFPDGGFVASYDEPKDPWKNAEYWTTEELVSAYKKSCEKQGTKPLHRLVQQLQKFACTGKRQDSLILKGEKLDQKHCECLEEVFRRVQFRQVDLEASHLDDECAVALFDMIEFYYSACQLNISFNKNISMRGWQACSRLIRRTPSLTALDMRNCDLNERSIAIMGRALKLGSHLTILHLENIYLSGRPLVILVMALKTNETLLELFLADNKLMPSDGIQLGVLLKYNHKLELMDLRNNHLQDVGTKHLADGLAEQIVDSGLLTLVLWNNQITYQGMPSLANCLMVVKNLETLNLGHNNITNEGIHQLKEGLLKNKSLLRLGLQGTKITCEGAVALAEYVADSIKLLRLDLRENDIKTAGLMGLSLALRMNETVTRIDVDKDTKRESGVKDYADQQRRLQQEIVWYQERNQVRAMEREEDARRELEERAEKEAELRKAAQELKEAQEATNTQITDDDDISYIPSMDKIQRPKLLFSVDQPPQQTLESPNVHCAQEEIRSPDLLSPTETPTASFLSAPPADLLLSPQYCPVLTAKKIFTVSRVSDNSPAKSGNIILDIPAPCVDVSSPFDQNPILVSPGTLCQNIASETMNEYIEQIVSEAIETEIHEQSCQQNPQTELISSNMQSNTDTLANENSSGSSDNSKCSQDSNVHTDSKEQSQVPNSVVMINSENKQDLNSDVGAVANNSLESHETKSPTSFNLDTYNVMLANNEVQFDSENGQSVQLTDSIVAELSNVPNTGSSLLSFDMLPSLDTTKNCENERSVAIDNNLNLEKSQQNHLDSFVIEEATRQETVKTSESMEVASELDPWLKIDSLDILQQNKIKKPDFHTNLTMNGLTEELASALDVSEETTSSEGTTSTNDTSKSPPSLDVKTDQVLSTDN